MRFRSLFIGAAASWVLLAPTGAHAQLTCPRLTLDAFGGAVLWDDASHPALDNSPMVGGRAGIQVRNWLGLEGTYAPAWTSTGPGQPPYFPATGSDARVNHLGLDCRFDLLPDAIWCPYVLAGWTQLEIDPDRGEVQTLNGWEAAGGVFVRLVDRVRLRFEARELFIDQDAVGDDWAHDLVLTAGVNLVLGGRYRDADGDGVRDAKDRCLDTPRGATVDAAGCPQDGDGDGVFDGLDRCSDTPRGARVDARGCPQDSDGDGVHDGLDQCAATPAGAVVDGRGCPLDADGDGVFDGLDRCASTPSGCSVDASGCPADSDGDGVCDGLDQCAATPAGAKVDATGCPVVVSQREVEFLDTGLLRLDSVRFASGKATILPESAPVLDEVGRILANWPALQVEIGGHTDSRGEAGFNQTLSEKRSQAVLDYLLGKYPSLQAGQYSVKGYGEAQPVADNRTEAGKAQNRRVEFKVQNREVLKKEVEKRGLLR